MLGKTIKMYQPAYEKKTRGRKGVPVTLKELTYNKYA